MMSPSTPGNNDQVQLYLPFEQKSPRLLIDSEANRIAGTSRSQLEQYLMSQQLPTSGPIQQLRSSVRRGNARSQTEAI